MGQGTGLSALDTGFPVKPSVTTGAGFGLDAMEVDGKILMAGYYAGLSDIV